MSYHAHRTLSDPARERSGLVRLIIGFLAFSMLALFAQGIIFAFLVGATGIGSGGDADFGIALQGRSPVAVIIMLLSFLGYFAALAAVLALLHRRGLASLIGPRRRALRQLRHLLPWLIGLMILALLLPVGGGIEAEPRLPFATWAALLPLSMAAILIQVSAEELVFRGYLQSQLAARFSHPLIWIALPSVLFGLLHYDVETYGENAWTIALWAILFGAVAADITARAGTLGPAIALHFVNNAYAFLLAAPEGYLDGLALFTYAIDLTDPELLWTWLPVELLLLLCTWLLARIALRA